MVDRIIGYRTFVDGTRRPVYQDHEGQFVLDEEGTPSYGNHLMCDKWRRLGQPAAIFLLSLDCCCAAAVFASWIAIAQVLNVKVALASLDEAAILGLVIGVLLSGPTTIAAVAVSREKVLPIVILGVGAAAFFGWLISTAITAMLAV
jgi:hypothetical protein